MKGKATSSKALRFGLIGIANALVDLGVYGLALQADIVPLGANFLGWLAAVTFSFAANSRLTFIRADGRSPLAAYLRFAGSGALVTLGISSLAVGLATPVIGAWGAKLAGIIAAAIINFFAARWSIESPH